MEDMREPTRARVEDRVIDVSIPNLIWIHALFVTKRKTAHLL